MTALTQLRKAWISISEQPLFAGAIIGLLAFAICIFFSIFHPPVPVVHDEFSYLLAADTFMHGRLANPPHPMWVFFEGFHITMLPTYVSKYPPMQGFALALGQLISGKAIIGVWISLSAASIAVYWMLRGWIAPGWALLGGLMVPLNGLVIYGWGLSFWGGAMAMLGGALLYGSVVRLVKRPRLTEAVLCGIGIAILAMSRPYEGSVASIPAAGYLFYGLFQNKEFAWGRKLSAVILPIGLVLLLSASFMGYYNYRTTGKVTKFAYMVYTETYLPAPIFFFGDAPPRPEYRHEVLKRLNVDFELERYEYMKSLSGFMNRQVSSFKKYWTFYSPSLLSIFILGLPFALRERRFRFIFFCCLFFGLSLFFLIPTWPHYAAPFAAVIVLAIVSGLRPIWDWEFRKKRTGSVIVITILILSMIHSFTIGVNRNRYRNFYSNKQRGLVVNNLLKKGGEHLVFVRYKKNHIIHSEWVWNGADIDGQPVVWARDMNEKANKKLIEYYKVRQVWLLETGASKSFLKPYPR